MESNVKPLNWAILGMGEIAGQMASQMKAEGRSIDAVGGRNPQKAAAGKTAKGMRLQETCDVMAVMTRLRKEWNVKYPGEQW